MTSDSPHEQVNEVLDDALEGTMERIRTGDEKRRGEEAAHREKMAAMHREAMKAPSEPAAASERKPWWRRLLRL
ncbi:MAG: hypothetical protein QNJ12_11485 [Ilumatobacter sp.]|uniref:hypothetical protein n=1 Tax=Ilumatobacter sp. TaxID=1967498 RepID=UPI0026117C45|nr:hypothetical protein [Ilumatobacter sp.]MDJ0769413.1 hypothetical protein [Ilumatobacter sp.]